MLLLVFLSLLSKNNLEKYEVATMLRWLFSDIEISLFSE